MIETTRLFDLLTTMTQRIEGFDPSGALRLKLLKSALEDETSVEMNAWADTDPETIIQPEVVLAQYHVYLTQAPRPIIFWATPLRTALLALPLLLTGYGLLRALQLYPAMLSSSLHTTTGSLLSWWQQGFNGQLPIWLRIGPLLVSDLIFILAFLFFTCYLSLGLARTVRRQQEEQIQQEQALRTDLTHLLALVTLHLVRYKSQLTVADNLTVVARRIDTMSRRLEDQFERITSRFEEMTQGVSGRFAGLAQTIIENADAMSQQNSTRFATLSQDMTQGLEVVTREVTNRYDGMSQQMMHRFSQITDRMLEQLLEGNKYLKEMGDLTGGVVQTAEQVSHAATLLKQTNGELAFQFDKLVTPMLDLAQQQEMLNVSATQTTQSLTDVVQTLAQLGRQQDRWGTDLRNMLDSLDLSNERTTEVALKVGAFASHQDTFLIQLQQAQQAQIRLIELLSQTSERLQISLKTSSVAAPTKSQTASIPSFSQ